MHACRKTYCSNIKGVLVIKTGKVYELDEGFYCMPRPHTHTYTTTVPRDECFEVFGVQPRPFLMPLLSWQFFAGFVGGCLLRRGEEGRPEAEHTCTVTQRWKWRLCHVSLSLFKVPKRKKVEQKESVCVCVIRRQTFRKSQLSESEPHMDMHTGVQHLP